MLPGVLVVGGARLAYPESFCKVHIGSWQNLLVLAVVTVTVGNALLALNRSFVHQLLEYFFYRLNIEGPIPEDGHRDYVNDLAKFVVKSFTPEVYPARIREHIRLRISTAFLLLTLSETALVFSCAHSGSSKLTGHTLWTFLVCVASFGAYIWQSVIARRIDYFVVKKSPADKDPATR